MYKGIYIALSGAVLKQLQMEGISDNLANANTTGFKKDSLSFRDYLINPPVNTLEQEERDMSTLSSQQTDFSQGSVFKTSNPMDLSIEGQGFIALEGNRYTRRGDLKRSNDGFLTSFNGIRILGNNGPIKLPVGPLRIDSNGGVYVNDEKVDTIKLLDLSSQNGLTRMGSGIFYSKAAVVKSDATVKQGYLEGSNVDVVKEMVSMIDSMREYETFQKAIQTFDEAAGKVTNDMAKI
ncbi:MAG: flagellar hook basal-body protein [Nitrospiraceae bacterium]|nr:flagellar hook basal-body protein [Nitrospiraceae bacterium]